MNKTNRTLLCALNYVNSLMLVCKKNNDKFM